MVKNKGQTLKIKGQTLKIFVSYAAEDRSLAEDVAQTLVNEGYDVFYDRGELTDGGAVDQEIRDHIETSNFAIFLLTPNTLKSDYVRSEIEEFKKKWQSPVGRVLPVMAEELKRSQKRQLSPYLNRIKALYPRGDVAADVASAVSRLTRASKPNRRTERSDIVMKAQLDAYRELWTVTGRLPKWGTTDSSKDEDLLSFSKELRRWYFDSSGGMFLSLDSYSCYADLQNMLTDLCEGGTGDEVSDKDYEEVRQLASTLRRSIAAEIGTRIHDEPFSKQVC